MATQKPDSGVAEAASGPRGTPDWSAFVPKSVDSEDALGPEKNQQVWEKLYRAAGFPMATEQERMAIRAGVYVYCAKNGTSREGDYSGDIVLSNGKRISAACIPAASGKFAVRKFLRANAIESYTFLKKTRCMEAEGKFVAKCATLGISAENAFATADWLTNCPLFTPGESRAHDASFTHGLDRSRRARDGQNLEKVEQSRVHANLQAQGPSAEHVAATDSW